MQHTGSAAAAAAPVLIDSNEMLFTLTTYYYKPQNTLCFCFVTRMGNPSLFSEFVVKANIGKYFAHQLNDKHSEFPPKMHAQPYCVTDAYLTERCGKSGVTCHRYFVLSINLF